MRSVISVFLVLATLAALSVCLILTIGPERVWNAFGPADLGQISFETLKRRSTPNDALACPAHLCQAESDFVPPLFATTARDLRTAMAKVIASEQRIVRVDNNDAELTERYIQRSKLMGFPDTIVIRYLDEGAGRSTLAMYSRSQLGRSDLGVNKARLERWLAKLKMLAPVAR